MTDELTKTFFDTFGIEERCILERYCNDCTNCACLYYPRITPEILLELICICNNIYINGYTNYFTSVGKTIEEIKKEILKKCIFLKEDIKHQVRTLFEEG